MTSDPNPAIATFVSGRPSALIDSAFNLVPIARTVPRGPRKTHLDSISQPGSPASASVGTSGSRLERLVVVRPSAFNFPALTCTLREATVEKCMATSPASVAAVEGGPPLYGT